MINIKVILLSGEISNIIIDRNSTITELFVEIECVCNLKETYFNIIYKLNILNCNNRSKLYEIFVNEEPIYLTLVKLGNIMNTVKNNGEALKYASENAQNNRDIVKAAVKNNGEALEYASERLRDDKEIVIYAVKNNREALKYASERLRNNKDIIMIVTH